MAHTLRQRFYHWLTSLGATPQDDVELRLRKFLLVVGALMFISAGLIWSLLYFALREPAAGLIPLGYSLFSLLSVGLFAVTHNYRLYRFSQLLLILLLPFFLTVALGGFVNSSAVIMWSLISPFGALVFGDPRHAPRWLLAYLALVVSCLFLQPYLRTSNNLSPTAILVFFALNISAVSSVAFTLLYIFVRQRNVLLAQLQIEQAKSENLLLNILPPEIAAILKNDDRTIADHFPGVSVLFADMVGFTPLTAAMTPTDMVGLLNEIFTQFDHLVDQFGLEKIRTIGDSYMVASGVPRPRPDHAQAIARLALAMLQYVETNPTCLRHRLSFRIGINSGPVVAGVIGRKKFIYDLWGDAVNTASRMESHGTPGQIQITRETYDLLKDEFVCEPRGTIAVKGKGEMDTWYLVADRSKQPAAA
jgi:adenylate cyclase